MYTGNALMYGETNPYDGMHSKVQVYEAQLVGERLQVLARSERDARVSIAMRLTHYGWAFRAKAWQEDGCPVQCVD